MTARKPAEIAMQTVTPPVSWLPGEGGGSAGGLLGVQEENGGPAGLRGCSMPLGQPSHRDHVRSTWEPEAGHILGCVRMSWQGILGKAEIWRYFKTVLFYRDSNPLKSKLMHLFQSLLYGI